jgi:hypothetical protein
MAVRVHLAVMAGMARGGAAQVLAIITAGVAMLVMVALVVVAPTVVPEETVVMAARETRMPSPMSLAALSWPQVLPRPSALAAPSMSPPPAGMCLIRLMPLMWSS